MGKRGQNKIPERWEQYSRIGNRIPDTKFICLKVPLKEEMCRNKAMTRSQWFTPADLFLELGQRGLKLGMLVDLTNTDRYYDPNTITYTGVQYAKINVAGQNLPNLKEVKEFFDTVDDFSKREVANDGTDGDEGLIGVHCTHGVNRSGYLVCRYLIERKGWSATKAVHEFNKARGHQIEREAYLSALQEVERNFVKTKYGLGNIFNPDGSLPSSKLSVCENGYKSSIGKNYLIFLWVVRLLVLMKFLQKRRRLCNGPGTCQFCLGVNFWG